MASLKAGTVADFENSLAAEMEAAMQTEWNIVKGSPLPSPKGEEDRKILFVAIARGLLKYLSDHQDDIETSEESSDEHDHTIEWNYE